MRSPQTPNRSKMTAHLAAASLLLVLSPALAQPQSFEDFQTWFSQGQSLRQASLEVWRQRVEDEGLLAVYEAVRQRVEAARSQAQDATEAEWARHFLTAMDSAQEMAEAAGWRGETETWLKSDAAEELSVDWVKVNGFAAANMFQVERPTVSPEYRLLKDPFEIVIEPTEDRLLARDLWLFAMILEKLLSDGDAVFRAITIEAVEAAEKRWSAFSLNVTKDQFVWETLVNGWVFKGSLHTPPDQQLRLLHPLPMAKVALEGETTFEPVLAVEVVGLRKYAADTYEPRLGVSLISTLKESPGQEYGFGLVVSYKNAEVGVIWEDTDDRGDVASLLVGIDLAGVLGRTKNKLSKLKTTKLEELKANLPVALPEGSN